MNDAVELLKQLCAIVEAGRRVALCVVVGRRGSAPQVPGAAMLVDAEGEIWGTVGGGKLEADVQQRAIEVLETGVAIRFALTLDEDDDEGAVCGGTMEFVVRPYRDRDSTQPVRAVLDEGERGETAWLMLEAMEDGRACRYRWRIQPRPVAVIAGAGHCGRAIAELAAGVGFDVLVIDDREEFLAAERFRLPVETRHGPIDAVLQALPLDPRHYVVIVTRGHRHDREALAAVLDRASHHGARYVGMIGSRKKVEHVFGLLRDQGFSRPVLQSVYAPIGLPIGSETVPEIAVSVVAQLIEVRRKHAGTAVEEVPVTANE